MLVLLILPFASAAAEAADIAPNAVYVSSSFCSSWETVKALNDGFDPASSKDHSHSAYGNWPELGTQWVQYNWKFPMVLDKIDVYWFADRDGIFLPSSCKLQYWDGSQFTDVKNAAGYGVEGDKYNITTFDQVVTDKMRLQFTGDGIHSTGILEWKVYGEVSETVFDQEYNIALSAAGSASYCSSVESVAALNDGVEPVDSQDRTRNKYGNWPKTGAVEWVQYDWPIQMDVNKVGVYWFDDGKKIRLPSSYKLQYWDGTGFRDVPDAKQDTLEKDKYVVTTFGAVKTSKLRLTYTGNSSYPTGILEWKVYGLPVVSAPPAGTNEFYKKYVQCYGIPVLASEKVSDRALTQSYLTIQAMMKKISVERPELIEKMLSNGGTVHILGKTEFVYQLPEYADEEDHTFRGAFGGSDCVVFEEHMDPDLKNKWNTTFNVLCHELTHVLLYGGIGDDQAMGIDPVLFGKIKSAYQELFDPNAQYCRYKLESAYDLNNVQEYFAGQVPRWFNCNPTDLNVPDAGLKTDREQLKLYDPKIYNIIKTLFGDYPMPAPWCY